MKKIFIGVVILFLSVAVLLFAKNIVVKIVIEKGVELATGLQLRMDRFEAGIFRSRINIDGLKLYNPKDFEDKVMVSMPNVYIDYNLPSIIKGKMHFYDIKLNLEEFVVVKNKDGRLNLDSLKVVQAQKESKDKPKPKAFDIQVDNLELKIGKVMLKDYSGRSGASVKEFNVNINEKYANITNVNAIVSIIVVKALMNTTIAGITNFDIRGLNNTVTDVLSKSTKLATDAAAKAVKTVGDTGKAAIKSAGEIVDKFKLPFGNE
ncbi:MAG: hypothetical protein PHR84_06225 [Candidatus Omnitrophica bacterium]|jgi:hypothetical protein|nr:hypothetical protein [Candidatus Omnitrophota bacterium]MDD5661356.1 hypothetical protein [Candidatus Omnitrophota bacterium]